MASKRLQAKIYHEPREGSWWSENPDVRGPRPPGQRPNSAKFSRNREFIHEDEPQVIIDRGTADLMSDVDRARIKARRGINKAKRTVKSARVIRKGMEDEHKWAPHVPFYIRHPMRWAGYKTAKVFHTKQIKGEMSDQQAKVLAFMNQQKGNRQLSPKKGRAVYMGASDDNGSSKSSNQDESDNDTNMRDETPLGMALGRDARATIRRNSLSPNRRRPFSAENADAGRPTSAGPPRRHNASIDGDAIRRLRERRAAGARPQTAGGAATTSRGRQGRPGIQRPKSANPVARVR